MEFARTELEIVESIKYILDCGGCIISDDYGVEWDDEHQRWVFDNFNKECCPFGAVLLKNQPKESDLHKAISNTLDVNYTFLWDFLPAFDKSQDIVLDYTDGGILGAKIRELLHHGV